MTDFPAVVATGTGPAQLRTLTDADLPDPGESAVTVAVTHSSLNYKDGLAVTGTAPIARSFPMICGIDLAGTVETSTDPAFAPGDEVVATGWGLGEHLPGGYTRRTRVPGRVLTRLPDGIDPQRAMAIGTAGLTAMLCVLALEDHGLTPDAEGSVLVTGAAGGVGNVAIAVLSRLGYAVTASSGRPETHDQLRALGATDVIDRAELSEPSDKPLQGQRWAAAIDTVGSTTLANALAQTRYRGAVAACGLAGGADLPASVLPFILRNVALLGIDSVQCPTPVRERAWSRLAADLPMDALDSLSTVEPMSRVPDLAEQILAGQVAGRVVIDTGA
ncbi:MDR family oxidoreductase [Nakamurella leprariae]|uniref:Oxidoreductase n=1 Tax=Nakamurella leprariae TaxID=2803911 RepID=A0A938YBG8_9ACTN|nr:MDR family oxidoreductase [Nakamurella leprariae]MBM9466536.1 oxidoreductase [Nakamurella leprariae]